ncbi:MULTISPECIES: type II toxin-antitoxin system RelE/ParE family toxin [Nostocales]|uniref:type II toxin-antitoxin system RelE family toxin n=1 Tax=Nostocales TaxID=1161 RepID=UPI00029B59AF|nr:MULTISPECIES: type II toxin-antitoxin system RelE/ParE family toxin [Nostocales]MBO1051345.1 type II toxin-antitoxin system RelE/ParE family toxin [Dolichospermum sp. DET73]AFW93017.1 RelE/StbE family protein [Anabaena sp. 90]MTJ18313.1 type II toxin-antitoxin system RelE/ParE family toxin [Dolichospermum sp. UHCC 0299]MTJ23353.1 type II toxin-antitoxin system RelE/ParE family toxin [Dolichospermum sp. UHCC 0352]MTJ37915.1 type II toxin-antitoxin system RelE/ParE family toxin [Dolichospermu
MKVQYRQTFLKDLKQLKSSESYQRIYELAFTTLENINSLDEILDIKAMKGYPNRYRIRIGNYRLGIEVNGDLIEVMRVLHRREFYRYFP